MKLIVSFIQHIPVHRNEDHQRRVYFMRGLNGFYGDAIFYPQSLDGGFLNLEAIILSIDYYWIL